MTEAPKKKDVEAEYGGGGGGGDKPPIILVNGLTVYINTRGHLVVANVDGQATPIPLDEYRAKVQDRLLAEAATLDSFGRRWVDPQRRHAMLYALPGGETAAHLLREIDNREPYDLYDVLADLAYAADPLSRAMRVGKFTWEQRALLAGMPSKAKNVVTGLTNQFALGGTDALESRQVFQTPEIVRAGGIGALKLIGDPAAVVRETKERLFAV